MEIIRFTYNLLSLKGIGRVKANKILSLIQSHVNNNQIKLENVYDILSSYITPKSLPDLFENTKINATLDDVKFITIIDSHYPDSLKGLNTNAPPIISYIGNIELLKSKKIGFCGSRKASDKGLSIASDISKQVVERNVTVVSGYASGIDQRTHYESLKAGGNTIMVLPMGINNFKIKKYLKEVWNWNNILVISEYLPDAIWSVSRAMQRNSTIISLSDIMVLIEAKEKGGSIDAGYKALNLKKPLFAPIYQGLPEDAKGNQILIAKGALPLKKNKETLKANLDRMFDIIERKSKNKNLFE